MPTDHSAIKQPLRAIPQQENLPGGQAPSQAMSFSGLPWEIVCTAAITIGAMALLLATGDHDYPNLHTAADTGMFLLSVALTLVLMGMGQRLRNPFVVNLAISFGLTAILEFLHVLVTVEWWGWFSPLSEMRGTLRPATWPPSAYILPIGILLAIWGTRKPATAAAFFLPTIAVAALALFLLFQHIPPYTPATFLDITRPGLILVVALWVIAAASAWRLRDHSREMRAIVVVAAFLIFSNTVMLYSEAPHDMPAMVAHLGRIGAYLIFLLTLMRMATADMVERVRAERALAHLNETLEFRIRERTAELEAANKALAVEGQERQAVLQALRESEARFRTLAETLPHLVWTCETGGWCDYLSRQWLDYTGRLEIEQLGNGWENQLHPEDRPRVRQAWLDATAAKTPFDLEFRIRRKDGVYRWFKTRAVPLRNSQGEIVKWFGSNTDFDDFKRGEERLQTQLRRLNLLHQITRAIGERQDLNSIFQVVIRSVEDELPADFCCLLLHDPTESELTVAGVGAKSEALAVSLAMPERGKIEIDANGLSLCLQGKLVYEPNIRVLDFPFPIRLARGGLGSAVFVPLQAETRIFGILVVARLIDAGFSSTECEFLRQLCDHTSLASHQAQLHGSLKQAYDDLRLTQQAVMQQERLRALGQLASGIAHDINNALTPALLYSDNLLDDPALGAEARTTLSIVVRAIEDAARTIARMRDFYRPQESKDQFAPVKLNEIVQHVVDLTRARWSDIAMKQGIVIDLQLRLTEKLPPIMGLANEIREALVNLVLNAIDALPKGGMIELRTLAVPPKTGQGVGHIQVEVADNGIGMTEEARQRCLEPFFTTKGDHGSGLGLAMVYGILQRHGADIEIDSEPGKGTTMRLLFPLVEEKTAAPETAAAPRQEAKKLKLLIIDDDPILLKTLHNILSADGHAVEAANGGQAGIDLFSKHAHTGNAFDAVMTDLGMPHIDGSKVAAAIKAQDADTPVILLTGWGQRLLSEESVPAHVDHVLSKPPRLHELRTLLAKLQPRSQRG